MVTQFELLQAGVEARMCRNCAGLGKMTSCETNTVNRLGQPAVTGRQVTVRNCLDCNGSGVKDPVRR